MKNQTPQLNRRDFLMTGAAAAAGAVALNGGIASASAPKDKKIALKGGIPEVEFGKTGHRLPVLGHGGSAMIEQWAPLYGVELKPRDEYVKMVRHGYERGIRYFDTARGYGLSEGIMGEALADVRDNVYIATKTAPRGNYDATMRDVETSLKELRTDYIDALQLHAFPGRAGFENAMKDHETLLKLKEQGVIRFIGLTNHSQFKDVYQAIATGGFDQCLIEHSYVRKGLTTRHSVEMSEWKEMALSKAAELGMGVVAMKCLGATVFSHNAKNLVPDYDPEKRKLLPAAAIRWVLSDKRIHILNIGVSMPEDFDKNIEILSGNLELTPQDQFLLAEFGKRAYEAESIANLPIA
jgi:predicted aldo/keto reductase-like oxidoreductase